EISGNIVMNVSGNSTWASRPVEIQLRTNTNVVLDSVTHNVSGTASNNYTYAFDLTGASIADKTLDTNEFLVLRVVNTVGQSNRRIQVHQRSGTTWPADYSFLTFNTPTVINVDAAEGYAEPATSGNATKTAYVQGD